MGKSAPKPPPAPDPTVVSAAQADANIRTAQETQRMNMLNTYGPQGNVVYGADPNAPSGYSQTTTLSPDQQQIWDLGNRANIGALGIANDQVGRIGQALSSPLGMDGLPELRGNYGQAPLQMNVADAGAIQTGFDKGGPLQYGFDPGQQVQGQVGGDLDRARYENMAATYGQAASRLDPRFETADRQLESRLANQGLGINSTAYQNARDQFGRERNDAYNQAAFSAIGAGENAANSLFQRQLGQGQFANQAAAQMYGQNMGQAAFNNQTAGQDYGQNMGAAQFANQAQQQQFGQNLAQMQAQNAAASQWTQQNQQQAQFGNETRNQGLQERAYLQNQPISQFGALMSGAQVQGPQGIQYSPTQVGQTDVLGAYALQTQAQQAAYQQQMANRSSSMGGLANLGMAALMAPMTGGGSLGGALGGLVTSDARVKTDIRRVGTLDNGAGLYAFRYLGGDTVQVGVMAQELAAIRPDLVHDVGGVLAVNYGGL